MSDKEKKNEITERPKRRLDKYGLYIVVLLLFFVAAIVIISLYLRSQLNSVKKGDKSYKYHFVFIGKSEDSYTANHIYEEAKSYGRQHDVYVEKLKNSASASYSDDDYVRMAKDMGVDGIIIEASDEKSLGSCIDEAAKNGVPTITILTDCPGSRKSFIEIGNYNLGREYARTIINITRTRSPKVMVFINEEQDGYLQVVDGIRETLANEGNHLSPELDIKNVGDMPNFRITELVKESLSDAETRPDILICVNEHDTKVVYQAARDYDLAEKTQLIGYGISEPLLRAVRDGEIAAIVDADSAQLGMMSVDVLLNYHKKGSCNDHIIVDDTVVTKDNVERYLDED